MKTPDYYQSNSDIGIPCFDAIRSALTDEEWIGFLKGNVIKYLWREHGKGREVDAQKLDDYANQLNLAIHNREEKCTE